MGSGGGLQGPAPRPVRGSQQDGWTQGPALDWERGVHSGPEPCPSLTSEVGIRGDNVLLLLTRGPCLVHFSVCGAEPMTWVVHPLTAAVAQATQNLVPQNHHHGPVVWPGLGWTGLLASGGVTTQLQGGWARVLGVGLPEARNASPVGASAGLGPQLCRQSKSGGHVGGGQALPGGQGRAGQGRTPPAVAAALTVLKEQPERQAERSQRTAHWSRAEASPSGTRSPPTCCIRCRTPSHLGASTNWEMPRPLRPRPTALLRPPGARRGSVATWTRAPAHRPSQLLHRGQRGPSSPRTFASWPRSCSANATGIELSTFGGPWGRVA